MRVWNRYDDVQWLWICSIIFQLKNQGMFTTNFMNKNPPWPNHTKAQEEINEMKGQYVGTIRAWKVTVYEDNGKIYMVAMVDQEER